MSALMIFVGAAGVAVGLGSMLPATRLVGLVPFVVAAAWVLANVVRTSAAVLGASEADALVHIRAAAKRMPLWITATAWTALVATICVATA